MAPSVISQMSVIVGIGILKGNVGLSYEHCKKNWLETKPLYSLDFEPSIIETNSVGRRSSFRFEHPCRSTKTLIQRKHVQHLFHGAISIIATPRNTCTKVNLRSQHVPRLFCPRAIQKSLLITCSGNHIAPI